MNQFNIVTLSHIEIAIWLRSVKYQKQRQSKRSPQERSNQKHPLYSSWESDVKSHLSDYSRYNNEYPPIRNRDVYNRINQDNYQYQENQFQEGPLPVVPHVILWIVECGEEGHQRYRCRHGKTVTCIRCNNTGHKVKHCKSLC